jgi:hypothetical protein
MLGKSDKRHKKLLEKLNKDPTLKRYGLYREVKKSRINNGADPDFPVNPDIGPNERIEYFKFEKPKMTQIQKMRNLWLKTWKGVRSARTWKKDDSFLIRETEDLQKSTNKLATRRMLTQLPADFSKSMNSRKNRKMSLTLSKHVKTSDDPD